MLQTFHDFEPTEEDFRSAVIKGFSARPKSLPPKFFYDAEGSRLFEQICELPEYYPTRTEIGMLERFGAEMAAAMGDGCHLIEFGSGAGIKTRIMLSALRAPRGYVAMDISRDHLRETASQLADAFPHIPVTAICTDYTQSFPFPPIGEGKRVGFFPGSTVGNFHKDEVVSFLSHARTMLQGGGFLIGVDLIKEDAVLNLAYDDPAGVTAAFNKNLLARCNRELGTEIELDAFDHRAFYNVDDERIEMYLVANRSQTLRVGDREFHFTEGEAIHTENSYKYTIEGFLELARRAGFQGHRVWTDADRLFSVHYLEAA